MWFFSWLAVLNINADDNIEGYEIHGEFIPEAVAQFNRAA